MQHRTTMPRTARLFGIISLLTILTLLAVACGGSDDSASASAKGGSLASTSGEPAAATAATAAMATTVPAPNVTAGSRDGDAAGAATLTGAVTATLDDPAACGTGVMGYDYQVVNSTTDAEDSFWMFQIYISNFEDTPGEYPVGADGYKRANVTLTDGAGTSWSSTADTPGTVVVADDQSSGTITATLTSDGSDAPVEVQGAWTCDAD